MEDFKFQLKTDLEVVKRICVAPRPRQILENETKDSFQEKRQIVLDHLSMDSNDKPNFQTNSPNDELL